MSQAPSAITDEMKKMIGHVWGPTVYEVEKGWIKKLAEAIEDPNPLFYDEAYAKTTRYGGIIAPPTFFAALREDAGGEWVKTAKCSLNTGAMNGGNDVEYIKPIRPGDVIGVTDKLTGIVEKDTKRGKMLFFSFEKTLTNQKGEVVAKARNTGIRY
ncbi:MAG: MaoC family dehydratase N-terminal domain-containing protein [Dehalococcoidia bacterium]|nr:MaoC family dehydratase N-terminal domain-containing protein [Dehalococcoidia bacterium]